MKQLLFLLLFPCIAMAQYTGNGNQKITLGEQSTADGLVYRGLAADTTRKPSVDTMAYILLDTNTNIIWQYKKATNNAWTRLNLTQSDTTSFNYVNTYGTQTVNGAKTFTSAVTATRFNPTSSTATGTGMFAPTSSSLGFSTAGVNKMTIDTNGNVGFLLTPENSAGAWRNLQFQNGNFAFRKNIDTDFFVGSNFIFKTDNSFVRKITGAVSFIYFINDNITFKRAASSSAGSSISFTQSAVFDENGYLGIGVTDPTEALHVVGNARITGAYSVTTGSAANVFVTTDGVLQRSTSSIKYKTDVEDYSKGLKEVMQLRPVTFKSINSNNDKTYAGFIAEELADLKLNELVENNDSGEPDAISYAYMVTLLTKAIQEQQEQISLLKKRLLILENK